MAQVRHEGLRSLKTEVRVGAEAPGDNIPDELVELIRNCFLRARPH